VPQLRFCHVLKIRCQRLGHGASLGLKKAKDLVDGAPKPVLEKVDKAAPWRLR
jgi:ribosomal protein L7/L12